MESNGPISLLGDTDTQQERNYLPERVAELILGHIASLLETNSGTLAMVRNHQTLNVLLSSIAAAPCISDKPVCIQGYPVESQKLVKRSLVMAVVPKSTTGFQVCDDVVVIVRALLELISQEDKEAGAVHALYTYVQKLRSHYKECAPERHWPTWQLLMSQMLAR